MPNKIFNQKNTIIFLLSLILAFFLKSFFFTCFGGPCYFKDLHIVLLIFIAIFLLLYFFTSHGNFKKFIKSRYTLVGIIIILVLLILTFAINQIQNGKEARELFALEKGLDLIKEGKIEEGMDICKEAKMGEGLCYDYILILKISNNETISKEFCDEFPIPTKKLYGKDLKARQEHVLEAQQECYDSIN